MSADLDDFLQDLCMLCRKHGAELVPCVYGDGTAHIQIRVSGWQTEREEGKLTAHDQYTACIQINSKGIAR